MRRNLAFYKTDFKEFCLEEYKKIIEYVDDDYEIDKNPIQKICIWDDGDVDMFMNWWNKEDMSILYEIKLYNYDLYDFNADPEDNEVALADLITKEGLVDELQTILD